MNVHEDSRKGKNPGRGDEEVDPPIKWKVNLKQ
jgi:hypothetical protein